MKKLLTATLTAAIMGAAVQADTIGGEIAIGGWSHDPSGWVKYPNYLPDNQSKLDVDDDLNLDTQSDLYLRAKLEHPIPLLPNLRLAYQRTESSGDGRIQRSIQFGNIVIGAGKDIYSETQLDNYDGTLYYEIVDMLVDFDLGLTVRYFDGYVKVQDKTTGQSDTSDIDFVVPMLYANFRWPIPFLDGLSIGAEGNWIGYDGSALYDLQADARYTFAMGLGVELGYRYQKIKLDDVEDTDADIDIQGIFGGIVWDF